MAMEESAARRLRLGVGSKLVILLAVALSALFGGVSLFVFSTLDRLASLQEQRAQLLDTLNGDLRAEVFAMQDRYLGIPARLEVDPQGALQSWLDGLPGARELRHEGREAIVARYRNRGERRDLQKPDRYVVEATDEGAALSYGLFDAGGAFRDAVAEWRLPGADPAKVEARVAEARSAGGAEALARKVAELEAELVDEALAAETTRNALLDQVEKIGRAGEELARTDRALRRRLLLVASGGLLLSLLLLFLVSRQVVTRPLGRIAAAARVVSSEEPLSLADARRADQIGDLARSVEACQRALAENRALQEAQVRERAETLATVERRLAEVAGSLDRQMQEGVAGATRRGAELATLAEALQARIEDGSRAAASAVRSAQGGAAATDEARHKSLALRDACLGLARDLDGQRLLSRSVAEEARQATVLVGGLTSTAEQIGEILALVDSIAGQISLLALNAMIEAAHAGKAGAGFAIVAGEVKALSLQTGEASKSIAKQIETIRRATGQASGTVARIEARIGDVDRSIAEVVASFAELVSTTTEIAERSTETAKLHEQLVAVSQSASEEAHRSDEMSRQMTERSDEIAASLGLLREELAGVLAAARHRSAA